MAHKVKCKVCGKIFDTDIEQGVKCGARRYAHLACFPESKELIPLSEKAIENKEKNKLMDYIDFILGETINKTKIRKQLKQYLEDGYTYTGIHKSLLYWYEINKNTIEKANGGIGIVPYIYADAAAYFEKVNDAKVANEKIIFDSSIDIADKVVYFNIKVPEFTSHKKVKLFNLDD